MYIFDFWLYDNVQCHSVQFQQLMKPDASSSAHTMLAQTRLLKINTVSELTLAVKWNSELVLAEIITPVSLFFSMAMGSGFVFLKIALPTRFNPVTQSQNQCAP